MTDPQSAAASNASPSTQPAPASGAMAPPQPAPRRFTLLSAILLAILGGMLSTIGYWLFIASDRYVSDATVIIRKTDALAGPALDVSMLIGGAPGPSRADQLLLREYLLSVDMLGKLDAALHLRSHYADPGKDWVSRLWATDLERFHVHYLARTTVEYDDFAGVVRIRAQAYDATTAHSIVTMLVAEGERYMNQLGHDMADAQVRFLTGQVEQAQQRTRDAGKRLREFQNETGMLSAQGTAQNIATLIAGLETQRAQVQTQLAALPRPIDADHPNLRMLQQSLDAIDRQIAQEKAKLTNPSGTTLNATLETATRLEMEVAFTQELYKAAATALEKGRIDAARQLQKVSVLQAPTRAEYAVQPRRIYNAIATLLCGLILAGIVVMTHQIIRDHVD